MAKMISFFPSSWIEFKRAFECRLCKRITISVFIAILVIEGGILFFSVKSYETDRLNELEREAVVIMRTILRSASPEGYSDSRFADVFKSLRDGTVLVGVRIYEKSGIEITQAGELPDLFKEVIQEPGETIRRRIDEKTRLDILWPSNRIDSPFIAVARIDTSEIGNQITAFVWRIFGLVLLISAFVTMVTMLVLDRMVFSQIINLNDRLTAIGNDPNHPEQYMMQSQRTDEWGEVIRSFNQMLQRAGSNLEQISKNERELQIAKTAAEQANLTKSEFLASMSHEIRTPMAGVMGFSDMLLEDALTDESKDKVFRIKDSTQSLLTILNEILDLSKLEAGKMEIENIDFHLPSLMDDILIMFSEKRTGVRRKGLPVVINMADDVPQSVNADPTRLRQILINLMSNAVKFTDKGSVTITVELLPSKEGKKNLCFTISDTGIGMKPETIAKLFSKFIQADASISRKYQGTGLGLSICKRLVDLMGGEIGVESRIGEGSTFHFTLPYVAATNEVGKRSRNVHVKFFSQRALRILAAEDNRMNQQIISATMQAYGHTLEIAEDGIKAINMHKEAAFDLILMDIRMPNMSGPDATRAIRELQGKKGKIPIIALTADAMAEHKKGYFDAGMDEVVTKPIDRAELLEAINRVMNEEIHIPFEDKLNETETKIAPQTDEAGQKNEQAEPDADIEDFLNQLQNVADKYADST